MVVYASLSSSIVFVPVILTPNVVTSVMLISDVISDWLTCGVVNRSVVR